MVDIKLGLWVLYEKKKLFNQSKLYVTPLRRVFIEIYLCANYTGPEAMPSLGGGVSQEL